MWAGIPLVAWGPRPESGSRLAEGRPEGLALTPTRTWSRSACGIRLFMPPVPVRSDPGRVTGLEGEFVVDRGAHPQRGVATLVVVVLDPDGDPLTGLGLGGEPLKLA